MIVITIVITKGIDHGKDDLARDISQKEREIRSHP
jgi:hypothetical protein